jgi:hypothetical protein
MEVRVVGKMKLFLNDDFGFGGLEFLMGAICGGWPPMFSVLPATSRAHLANFSFSHDFARRSTTYSVFDAVMAVPVEFSARPRGISIW